VCFCEPLPRAEDTGVPVPCTGSQTGGHRGQEVWGQILTHGAEEPAGGREGLAQHARGVRAELLEGIKLPCSPSHDLLSQQLPPTRLNGRQASSCSPSGQLLLVGSGRSYGRSAHTLGHPRVAQGSRSRRRRLTSPGPL